MYSSEFFPTEMDRQIYRDELAPFLPARIWDAHVHLWSDAAYPEGTEFRPKSIQTVTGGSFDINDFNAWAKDWLPEQEVTVNCFGPADIKSDLSVLDVPGGRHTFMTVVSPADPAEVMAERIESSGAAGVKPYLVFAAAHYKKPVNEVEIFDMLTPEQLEYLNSRKLAVTLHIPRSRRFADPLNQKQMRELCEKYPDITFIFAHVGRAYYMQNLLQSNISELAAYPNCYFDTAMINHEGVLKRTFDSFPLERILFGTDVPVSCVRGKSVEINNQYAYLVGQDFRIGTAIYDTENAVEFTTFYYEQLRAVIAACPAGGMEDFLYNNSEKLFRRVTK